MAWDFARAKKVDKRQARQHKLEDIAQTSGITLGDLIKLNKKIKRETKNIESLKLRYKNTSPDWNYERERLDKLYRKAAARLTKMKHIASGVFAAEAPKAKQVNPALERERARLKAEGLI